MVHIGKVIEKVFIRRGCSKQWLAKQICCHRTNVTDIFTRPSIDTEFLRKLCIALDYDFFQHLSVDYKEDLLMAEEMSEEEIVTTICEEINS